MIPLVKWYCGGWDLVSVTGGHISAFCESNSYRVFTNSPHSLMASRLKAKEEKTALLFPKEFT